jgi:hypothetical protein
VLFQMYKHFLISDVNIEKIFVSADNGDIILILTVGLL